MAAAKGNQYAKGSHNGRLTDYNDEIVKLAWQYIDNYADHDHAMPSVVGLCSVINLARSTVYKWAEEEDKEFSDILDHLLAKQQLCLLNNGLTSTFNSTITKLILTKHGYSDKQELEHSGDGISFNLNYNPNAVESTGD